MENKEICKKISSMLSLYIDNRTTLEEKIYIENHLENCPVCYKKYIYLKSLIKDLKNSYKQVLELTKRKEKLKLFNIREHENFMQNISPYVDNELSPNECLEFRKYLVKSKNAQNELKKLCNTEIKMRIGINTGFAVVGNMGSSKRFDYTMLGDSVNLASRLEGINKQFGLYTLCSEETKLQAEKFGSKLKFIEIAKVQVVGKTQAVTVFTAMQNETFEENKIFWQKFESARNLFYQGEIEQAQIHFDKISNELPVANKYFEKCKNTQLPIQSNLKGIWIATEK
jgi:hypothetical protein